MPSPYSYVDYGTGTSQITGDQLNGIFTPNLEYVSKDDIYVTWTIDSTGEVIDLLSNQFTVTESPQLTVSFVFPISGYSSVNANDLVRIGRTTDIDQKARTYSDGSVLKASDINTQNNQFLYAIQESLDSGGGALPIDTSGNYNAGGRRIKNIGEPVDSTDVASKSYVIGQALYNGAELPQSWTFTTPTGGTPGDNYVFDLVTPIPASDIEDLFLVEVAGVLQVPITDYTVSITGSTYRLSLINGVNNIGANQQVAVRNFGTRRQVLSTPFKSDGTNATLRLEGIPGQTVPYFEAKDSNSINVFSINSSGALLFGAGTAPNQLATGYHDPNQFGVGRIDTSGGTVNYDEYGVRGQTGGLAGQVDIQGIEDNSNSTTSALQVIRLDTTGTVHYPFKATYGGALDLEGTLTATAVIASNPAGTAFSVDGTTVHNGDIQISVANPYRIHWGASDLVVNADGLDNTKSIKVENYTVSQQGNSGIMPTTSTTGASGVMIFTEQGWVGLYHGGDGNGVAYGGVGSPHFTYQGAARNGPHILARDDNIVVGGYKVDSNQIVNGAGTGQTGDEPASISLPSFINVSWLDVDADEVVTKSQIDARINQRIPSSVLAIFNPGNVSLGGIVSIPQSNTIANYDPDGDLNWANSAFQVTEGAWLITAEGSIVASGSSSATSTTVTMIVEYSNDGGNWTNANTSSVSGTIYTGNTYPDNGYIKVVGAVTAYTSGITYIRARHSKTTSGGSANLALNNRFLRIERFA